MTSSGWFRPKGARVAHYDDGGGVSLCGMWASTTLFETCEVQERGALTTDCLNCKVGYLHQKRKAA